MNRQVNLHSMLFEAFFRIKTQFKLIRCPRLSLGPSKRVYMEVLNKNNDRRVISIPRLNPRALITPRSLFIHYPSQVKTIR